MAIQNNLSESPTSRKWVCRLKIKDYKILLLLKCQGKLCERALRSGMFGSQKKWYVYNDGQPLGTGISRYRAWKDAYENEYKRL